jgi:DNA-binding response OmpR family regulator
MKAGWILMTSAHSSGKKHGMVRNFLPTVVVADPDRLYQQHIAFALQQSFRCIVTGSLRETYQAIWYERPALLTLELSQPDGDGLHFIRYLHADPTLKNTLIACVTQRATILDKLYAFRAGADDYIVKPLSKTFCGQILLLNRAGLMARRSAVG